MSQRFDLDINHKILRNITQELKEKIFIDIIVSYAINPLNVAIMRHSFCTECEAFTQIIEDVSFPKVL